MEPGICKPIENRGTHVLASTVWAKWSVTGGDLVRGGSGSLCSKGPRVDCLNRRAAPRGEQFFNKANKQQHQREESRRGRSCLLLWKLIGRLGTWVAPVVSAGASWWRLELPSTCWAGQLKPPGLSSTKVLCSCRLRGHASARHCCRLNELQAPRRKLRKLSCCSARAGGAIGNLWRAH